MLWRFLLILLMAATCTAQTVEVDRMDQVVHAFVEEGQFMGAILVAHGDQVSFDKAYGEANVDWHVLNTVDTKFRLASITKQFTAAAVLLLEEQGKLRLSDRVSQYVPELPEAWREVTIFHLLTHTSGLPSVTSVPDFARRQRLPTTPLDTLHWVWNQPLIANPGTEYHYSNQALRCFRNNPV